MLNIKSPTSLPGPSDHRSLGCAAGCACRCSYEYPPGYGGHPRAGEKLKTPDPQQNLRDLKEKHPPGQELFCNVYPCTIFQTIRDLVSKAEFLYRFTR